MFCIEASVRVRCQKREKKKLPTRKCMREREREREKKNVSKRSDGATLA